jgi:hypothetical protein
VGGEQVQQNRSKRDYEEGEAQREKIIERGEVRFISAHYVSYIAVQEMIIRRLQLWEVLDRIQQQIMF